MSLITEDYRKMQSDLHLNPEYGISSTFFAPIVDMVIAEYQIEELLDYGAGKCRLRDSLTQDVKYIPYEPSNPLWDATPSPAELVACIDVLEHIEPECLDDVLDDLQRCVLSYGIFTIHTGAAVKVLPDGRNAHLIQEPWEWWQGKLSNRFGIIRHIAIDNGIVVLVKHKD
jgi:hypothetical protein